MQMYAACRRGVFWKLQWSSKAGPDCRAEMSSTRSLSATPSKSSQSPPSTSPQPAAPGEDSAKGNHPAALNLGDCIAYALSQITREPLLFKGDDFTQTDIQAG